MWRTISKSEEPAMTNKALPVMCDSNKWGYFMKRVVVEWVFSCEQNLSHNTHNKIAWLGQASKCLATGCPEYLTRRLWWLLSEKQKQKANNAAREAIEKWEQVREYSQPGNRYEQLAFDFLYEMKRGGDVKKNN